jgi:hypothetical protein
MHLNSTFMGMLGLIFVYNIGEILIQLASSKSFGN